ncbi:MAG TPA: hydrogenase expression/formation protein HypE [Candidatus Dormibacteraeota bacterium]|nr:hydrogenase expression/formation protein HypE [Candidatus Dormibacteraeota bacterium]
MPASEPSRIGKWSEQEVLERIEAIRRRAPRLRDETITTSHGAGGKATHTLVEALFRPAFGNPAGDAALAALEGKTLAVTTDSYVVSPLFFPGGDIGELAVNGTVNDLAVAGARPLYVTAGFILEEGLPVETLRRVVESMARAATRAGVQLVAGDTKVVPRGKADLLFVNTTGVGLVAQPGRLGVERVRPGDAVLVSGTVGDHGTAIMLARGDLQLETDLESDTAPLHELCAALLEAGDVRLMRDATRGGVATVLNELATEARVAVAIREDAVPVRDEVRGAAEILGVDPMYMANEGKLVAVVAAADAEAALAALRAHPLGERAAILGEIRSEPPGMVFMHTAFGGSRVVDMLIGDPLPRIC